MSAATAERKLIFVGLLGMYDAPRREVKKAVAECAAAGIRITIITGDFGITARAIAKELRGPKKTAGISSFLSFG